jgi:hypothetical protein
MERLNMFYRIQINSLEKMINKEGFAASEESDGFRCYYTMKLELSPGGNLGDLMADNSPQAKFFASLNRMAVNQTSKVPREDLFVLTEDGWRSPTVARRGIESIIKSTTSLADGLANTEFPDLIVLPGGSKAASGQAVRRGNRIIYRYPRR